MVKKGKSQTLEEIASKYQIVLMDSSVLIHYLGGEQYKSFFSFEKKGIALEEEHQCRIMLMDYLNKKGLPCFITSSVLEEFQAGDNYPYKKMIKRDSSYKNARLIPKAGSDKARKLLKLRRKIKDAQKGRRKLINTFQENNRVLELNESEHNLYNIFDKTYSGLLSYYGLSKVDFDFLLSGAVTSKIRESSALISNDFGLVRAWNYIRKKEKISSEQFGFVIRTGLDDFEIL